MDNATASRPSRDRKVELITGETTVDELDRLLRSRRAFLRIRLSDPNVVTSYDAAVRAEAETDPWPAERPSLHEVLAALFARSTDDTDPDPVRLAVERMRKEGTA